MSNLDDPCRCNVPTAIRLCGGCHHPLPDDLHPDRLRAERDQAVARAEAAERLAKHHNAEVHNWMGEYNKAAFRAERAEAKLAALMPLVPLLDAAAMLAGGWQPFADLLHAWDNARAALATLDAKE